MRALSRTYTMMRDYVHCLGSRIDYRCTQDSRFAVPNVASTNTTVRSRACHWRQSDVASGTKICRPKRSIPGCRRIVGIESVYKIVRCRDIDDVMHPLARNVNARNIERLGINITNYRTRKQFPKIGGVYIGRSENSFIKKRPASIVVNAPHDYV